MARHHAHVLHSAGLQSADLAIEFMDGPIGSDDHTLAGDWMRDGGTRLCTSGFTVTKGGSFVVTTAGHCDGIDTYEEKNLNAYSAPYQNYEHRGEWRDVEWHTTPSRIVLDDFWVSFTVTVDVTGVMRGVDMYIGMHLCGFGMRTEVEYCDDIYDVSVNKTDEDGYAPQRLTAMVSRQTDSGDSGGPWYLGGIAVGDHRNHHRRKRTG